eukprot:scaffold287_cov337-Pavlova_lutheri.AAC.224
MSPVFVPLARVLACPASPGWGHPTATWGERESSGSFSASGPFPVPFRRLPGWFDEVNPNLSLPGPGSFAFPVDSAWLAWGVPKFALFWAFWAGSCPCVPWHRRHRFSIRFFSCACPVLPSFLSPGLAFRFPVGARLPSGRCREEVPFGVPTTCWWFFACRNRARPNLGTWRAVLQRTPRDLSNELSFARLEPIFKEIRASKGRSTRQGKRGRIQPRKTLGRARASLLSHGPN